MKKVALFKYTNKVFYEDMTYWCDHWPRDRWAEYKFVENDILYLHCDSQRWGSFYNDDFDDYGDRKYPIEAINEIKALHELAITRLLEEAMRSET
jgi:hypothetical protein